MKKISVFAYSMGGGGGERVISNLLGDLAAHYEVHLILMNESIAYALPKGVAVHFLENSRPFENGVLKFLKLPFLALKYKKLCAQLNIDLHFVWLNRPCYIAALARIFGDKKPLVMNECSTPSVIYKNKSFKSLINKFFIRRLYKRAEFIYPNSAGALEDLALNFGISREKMRVLYNALNLDEISAKSLEKIDEKTPFFLSVGRLDAGKNHELLIRAYAKLKNCDKNLIILGDGVLKERLNALICELNLTGRVKLAGFDSNPYKYLARCYAFVFTSLFEGFSNVLIEALACGKMVISSDHESGARELLGDDKWGVLTALNDVDSTEAAMQRAIDEPNLVKFYEKNATIRASFFDKNKIASDLINELDKIGKF